MTAQSGEEAGQTAPIDRDVLAASIARDSTTLLQRHFGREGGETPQIIWSPKRAQLGTPILQSFADICDTIGETGGPLRSGSVRLSEFDGLDRWMMVLENEGPHYRYTHYGSEITNHYGQDMSGRSTADFEGYIGTFFAALYAATGQRRERVLSVHEPPARVFVREWRRLIVPVVNDEGDVTGFVAANVPENELRTGLEMIVDPIFVTDQNGEVQYFNEAARSYFKIPQQRHRSLDALAGLEFPALPPPEILLARREIVERVELVERKGGMMDRFAMSVSAAEHRGRAFYVFHLRNVATA